MTHGAPDYSDVRTGELVYRLDDMGELAVRLGSSLTYDRRGNVLWVYDFDYGIDGLNVVLGIGANLVGLSKTYWESPPYSMYIKAVDSSTAQPYVNYKLAVPPLGKVGIQSTVRFSSLANSFLLKLVHHCETNRYYSYLEVKPVDKKLKVFTGNSGLVTIDANIPDLSDGYYFAHLKLVCDLSTHTLVRALLDSGEYDLTSYTMQEGVATLSPCIEGETRLVGNSAGDSYVYVDNIAFTDNEP